MKVEEIIELLKDAHAATAMEMETVSQQIQQLEMQFAHLRISLENTAEAIEVLQEGREHG